MDPAKRRKLNVIIVLALSALFASSLLLLLFTVGSSRTVVLGDLLTLGFIAILIYEGWERIKKIDKGLEDAVNDC